MQKFSQKTSQLPPAFLLGADSVSEAVGELKMISRNTAAHSSVYYGQKAGGPLEIRLIFVMTGTIEFTGPDNAVVNYTNAVYLASADADKDGFPDPGSTPLFMIPGVDTMKRVPIP